MEGKVDGDVKENVKEDSKVDGEVKGNVKDGKRINLQKLLGGAKGFRKVDDVDNRELEKEIMSQLDQGILESITDELNIIQVNMGKKHGWDELAQYMSEDRS